MIKTGLVIIAVSAVFLQGPFLSAARAGKFTEKIEKTEKLLREEQALHEKEKKQSESAQKSLTDRIEMLEGKIKRLETKSEKTKKLIKSAKKDIGIFTAKKRNADSFFSRQRTVFVRYSENLKKLLNPAFRDYEDKNKKLNVFGERTKNSETDLAELFRELSHYYIQEIEQGFTSEIYSAEVETEKGEIEKAKFLRAGNIVFAYRTNDGAESGIWLGGGWMKNPGRHVCSSIRKALETMEGKRIPKLFEFPVEINPEAR
ncbi:MAG: DUF3450 family protein [Elusimicrobiota bacterium]|nr:DUF3450 family protein [Elusimicrobiota bacterium]